MLKTFSITAVALLILFQSPDAFAAGELAVTGSASYDSVTGRIDYTIDWAIASSTQLTNLAIESTIPAGTTFASVGDNGSVQEGYVRWMVGTKQGPSSGAVHFSVALDAAQALNPWASEVVSFTPGVSFGSSTPLQLPPTEPEKVLGNQNNAGLPLGFSGTATSSAQLVLAFSLPVVNESGNDIKVFSVTSSETARVEASADLQTWVTLGAATSTEEFDLKSLATAKYIRFTDTTSQATALETSQGFVVDAVRVLHLFPLSCNVTTKATAYGEVGGITQTAATDVRLDLVENCGSGGSGLSGISGISGADVGFGRPTQGTVAGTSTPTSGESSANAPTTTLPTQANPAPSSPSTDSVTIAPVFPPSPGSSDQGGATPEVLGASTGLPRTGVPSLAIVLLLPFLFLLDRLKISK